MPAKAVNSPFLNQRVGASTSTVEPSLTLLILEFSESHRTVFLEQSRENLQPGMMGSHSCDRLKGVPCVVVFLPLSSLRMKSL